MKNKLDSVESTATVASTGAILLGSVYSVDGYYPGRLVRIVTHIHQDHIIGLRESIKESAFLIATPLTIELLEAMGYRIPDSKKLPLNYGQESSILGERVKLLKSNHIPGSAQVQVELPNGMLVGYTGDFKLPSTPIMKDLDILVIDATYGSPSQSRPWQNEVEDLLVDIVKDALAKGPVVIYGYHGKLQEVMLLLRSRGIDAPFVLPLKIYKMTRVLVKHGYAIDNYYLENTREAYEIMRDSWYIYFKHAMSKPRLSIEPTTKSIRIILTGRELTTPFRQIDPKTYIVSYSSHADFNQLLEYVREAKPKLLVVDGFRGGAAASDFAAIVTRKYNIKAIVKP